MKILFVYAHPEQASFNHALKEEAIAAFKQHSYEVQLSDLYAMNFNPVASWDDFKAVDNSLPRQYGIVQREAYLNNQLTDDIKLEQEKLLWCDAVIFQFPLWWFGVPAILKGWFDRIISAGFAYDKEKWFSTGLLKPRQAMLSVTTQSPINAYQADGMHGNIDQYLHPIHHTLRFTGITILPAYIAYGVMNLDENERKNYLSKYNDHLIKYLS